jgi:hypothetical protein
MFLCCFCLLRPAFAQKPVFTLSEAIQTGLQNYNSIKAKKSYQGASTVMVENARRQFLPDVNTAIQQNYGTANGQFGPLYSYKGVGIAAAGQVQLPKTGTPLLGRFMLPISTGRLILLGAWMLRSIWQNHR